MAEQPSITSRTLSYHSPNTEAIPMYWVKGQWMVPSGPSRQPCNHGTAKFKSWASPAPRLTRASPTPGCQNCAIATRTHDQPGPRPPLGVSSTSCDRTQYLYHYSPQPTVASTGGSAHYPHPTRASPQLPCPASDTTSSSSTTTVNYHQARRNAPWTTASPRNPPTTQSSRSLERRADSRTAASQYERRHKSHLDSEKRRRESIRVGLDSLRQVVPSASDTDSKASILNKAVGHIVHLESLLQEIRRSQGITLDPNPVNDFISIKNEDQG